MNNIAIEHNMAIECITTMLRITEADHFKNYIDEHKFSSSTNINEKLQDMKNKLNSFEKSDLQILFKNFKLNFYYLLMFITEKNIKTVDELINELEKVDSDLYLSECFRISSYDISIFDKDDKILKEVSENSSIEDSLLFIEFKNNTKLLKNKLTNIIEIFYRKVFRLEEEWISSQVDPILSKHISLFNENKKGFIDIIGNGNYESMLDGDKEYKIYLCYLEEFIPRCLFDKGKYTFVYGFGEEQKLNKEKINPQEIFKNLSDETRIRILSLLSQKKWTRRDLVKEIGLTSATMTYQLNKLISLGLIDLVVGGDSKKTLYTLNKENFRTLINSAVDEIIL